ncbi:MAG: tryptophan-rich sensory protein [Eubacteriaceae bacterium]|nr:tryptophan-rich sensory protein [Eubacteriaceae bacterium]
MTQKKKTLIAFIALTFAVGLLAGFLIMDYTDNYLLLEKPPVAPPKWLFPVAWNTLYLLISVAGALAYDAVDYSEKRAVLLLYGLQLLLNFLWPVFFFRVGNIMLAFYDLIALWVVILVNIIFYARVNKYSSYLFIPYILWVSFAAYLNYGIYILN